MGKRTEDIPILVDHFVRQDNDQGITVSHNALRALMTYNWPGNIRQLKNVIEHALVVVEDGKSIDTSKLPAYITNNSSGPAQEIEVSMKPLNHIVREGEETAICNALKYCNGNKSRAAKLLGISRSVFYYKLKRYGLLDN